MNKSIGAMVVLATYSSMCFVQQPWNIAIRCDDSVVSQTLAEFVTDLGNSTFHVDTAELTNRLEDADSKVEILITSVEQSGENGVEYLQSMHKKHPKVAVMLNTNGGTSLFATEAKSCGVHYFLREPIRLSGLEFYLSRFSEIHEELAKKNKSNGTSKVMFASGPVAVPTTLAKSGTANMHRCC